MNALNAQPADQAGMLASIILGAPGSSASAPPADSGFLNIINMLLSPDATSANEAAPLDISSAAHTLDPASTKTLANALIRSMLGHKSGASPQVKPEPPEESTPDLSAAPLPVAAPALTSPPPIETNPAKQVPVAVSRDASNPRSAVAVAPDSPLAFSAAITPKQGPAENQDGEREPGTGDSSAQPKSNPAAQFAALLASAETAPVPTPAPPPQSSTHSVAAPAPISTTNAIRNSEPVTAPAPALRSDAQQEIAIRIARPESPAVDLRIAERDGQIHVAVHTPDASLQNSLRQQVGTLVESLDRAGFHTQTFAPTAVSSSTGSAFLNHRDAQPDTRQDSPYDSPGRGSQNPGSRGDQQQQPQQRQPQPQGFDYEMENA